MIDGHKVVINETEYKQDGDGGKNFFKVRIVDIHPIDSAESTEASAEAAPTPDQAKDVEPLEASVENEIPKNQENEVGKENVPEKLTDA